MREKPEQSRRAHKLPSLPTHPPSALRLVSPRLRQRPRGLAARSPRCLTMLQRSTTSAAMGSFNSASSPAVETSFRHDPVRRALSEPPLSTGLTPPLPALAEATSLPSPLLYSPLLLVWLPPQSLSLPAAPLIVALSLSLAAAPLPLLSFCSLSLGGLRHCSAPLLPSVCFVHVDHTHMQQHTAAGKKILRFWTSLPECQGRRRVAACLLQFTVQTKQMVHYTRHLTCSATANGGACRTRANLANRGERSRTSS